MIQFNFEVLIGSNDILKMVVQGFFNALINSKFITQEPYDINKKGIFIASTDKFENIKQNYKKNFQFIQEQYNEPKINFQMPKNIISIDIETELERDTGLYYVENDIFIKVTQEENRFCYKTFVTQDNKIKIKSFKSKIIPNLDEILNLFFKTNTIKNLTYGLSFQEQLSKENCIWDIPITYKENKNCFNNQKSIEKEKTLNTIKDNNNIIEESSIEKDNISNNDIIEESSIEKDNISNNDIIEKSSIEKDNISNNDIIEESSIEKDNISNNDIIEESSIEKDNISENINKNTNIKDNKQESKEELQINNEVFSGNVEKVNYTSSVKDRNDMYDNSIEEKIQEIAEKYSDIDDDDLPF